LAKAAKNANLSLKLEEMHGKTIALAYSSIDEVEPAKIVYNFSKSNNAVSLVGGIVNCEYFEKNKAVALAQLPSRDELYAKVVGSLSAPLSGMVNVLSGNLRGLVSVLKQYSEKKV
jgi:large subunit ribosomal protein L10